MGKEKPKKKNNKDTTKSRYVYDDTGYDHLTISDLDFTYEGDYTYIIYTD